MYTNIGKPKYIKLVLTEIKGERDNNTIIVGDFNIPLISNVRLSRQKISKKTHASSDALDQMNLQTYIEYSIQK